MEDLSRTFANIIKLQILINIATFSGWNFMLVQNNYFYLCSYIIYYQLFPNGISRITIKKAQQH